MASIIRAHTPLGRISYPWIFQPKTETGKDGSTYQKYQCAIVWDQSVQAELQELINKAYQVGIEEFGEHFWTMVQQGSVRWPFRDGGEINPNTGQPRYGQGLTYINMSSQDAPDVVSRYYDPADPNKKPRKVTDPRELWPGQYVKASVTIKAYKRKDSRGISLFLNSLQLWHEGERLDNRVAAEDDFSAEGEAPPAQMGGAGAPPQQQPAPPAGGFQQPPAAGPQAVPGQPVPPAQSAGGGGEDLL